MKNLSLTGLSLERSSELRLNNIDIQKLKNNNNLILIPVWAGKNLFDSSNGSMRGINLSEALKLNLLDQECVFLGFEKNNPYFAVSINEDEPSLRFKDFGEFKSLHTIINIISFSDATILAYARGMCTWHSNNLFCGKCGQKTHSEDAGHLRVCENKGCLTKFFPRIDPAVITLVEHPDGKKCLLGRQSNWPLGMYSVVAGFLEIGESLEECVVREVMEETGIKVESVIYQGSQPWPFPSSLMLGFVAKALNSDFSPSDDELEEILWVTREDLNGYGEMNDGVIGKKLPNSYSIARQLIEQWRGKEIK